MSHFRFPSPRQLQHAPELTVIAVLDASLQAAVHMLHAIHAPMARVPDRTSPAPTDSYVIAALLVRIADELAEAIRAYRHVLDREQPQTLELDELPF